MTMRHFFGLDHLPRCVVFDLDGTLVDSRLDIASSVNHGLTCLGQPPRTLEEIAPLIGRPLVDIYEFLLESDRDRAEEAASFYRDHYFDHCAVHSRLYPGIEELLDALSSVPLAIATTKMTFMAVEVLRRLGIEKRFAAVKGCDGIPHKPHPAVVNLALEAMGCSPREGWMVGDTILDVEAGRRAGLSTCAVTWGFGDVEALYGSGADLIVDEPSDLMEKSPKAARIGH